MYKRLLFERVLLWLGGALLVAFLLAPVLALFVTSSFIELMAGLVHPLVGPALRLSLVTTTISLVIVVVFGTPLAWMLARSRGRIPRALEILVQLPIVVPPAVAGVGLLFAFGRRGLLTGVLYPQSWALTFTTIAVVMAEIFVSAPFFIQAASAAFRRIDDKLIVVARSFGASPLRIFFRVALPLAAPGLAAGAAMSWARSLGEFGATLMFAGNLQGRTQTLPLAIYVALEADPRAAQALSIILITFAVGLLATVHVFLRRVHSLGEVLF